ncbi:MAG: nuclear transport factor 2 family protein [Acidimicrobiaceae bacterium]|nr:nuclear transport factor 2 family protein [Acidimicrobiaceae bacterium]MYG98358.1 nuclear transport factor 2 family protein [Acidimicrobiaceae bacterium]MYL02597.1 nuclear transport factor 2 family protein [Acidimicrobiaceae bacterium]
MADDTGQDHMSGAESVVRRYWERIWLERDLDALESLVSEPIVRHGPDGTETLTRRQLRQRLASAFDTVRASEVSFDAVTTEGATVWVRLTVRGVSLATAAPMSLAWLAQYRVEGGRIVELWGLHQASADWSA